MHLSILKGCIELKWAIGKGFVAHPDQQAPKRSVGTVISQLRKRWYDGHFDCDEGVHITEDQECLRMVEHCEKVMQDELNADYEKFYESENCVSGDLFNLQHVPDDLTQWK